MRRPPFSQAQSRAMAAKMPRLLILWGLVAVALASVASIDRVTQSLDGYSRSTLENVPAIVQTLIERYAPE